MSKMLTLAALTLGLTAGPVFAGVSSPSGVLVAEAEKKTDVKVEPTGEHMSDAQKANLEGLVKELQAIQANSDVTEEQKQALATSLSAMADGATQPSEESVEALASSLSTAKKDGEIDKNEAMQIAQDISKVFSSAEIPPEEVKAAATEVQGILEASGVDKDTAKQVADDLMKIGEELKKNAAEGQKKVEEATGGKKGRRGR